MCVCGRPSLPSCVPESVSHPHPPAGTGTGRSVPSPMQNRNVLDSQATWKRNGFSSQPCPQHLPGGLSRVSQHCSVSGTAQAERRAPDPLSQDHTAIPWGRGPRRSLVQGQAPVQTRLLGASSHRGLEGGSLSAHPAAALAHPEPCLGAMQERVKHHAAAAVCERQGAALRLLWSTQRARPASLPFRDLRHSCCWSTHNRC